MDNNNPMVAKKAVHVKWAGKTIALGTFPIAEADEKCTRAKALTRAWRSTMRPKPTREWVIQELERVGVRLVSGRQGREDEEEDADDLQGAGLQQNHASNSSQKGNISMLNTNAMNDMDPNMRMAARNASLDMYSMNRFGGGMGNMMGMNMLGLHTDQSSVPPHRPMVGGGAAAAYEAAREQHYRDLAERRKGNNGDYFGGGSIPPSKERRGSDQGSASFGGEEGSHGGLSASARQHYEMLKLHHMNLLNEIQETTLMMNIYQQQQLQHQKEQQQLQDGLRDGSKNSNSNNISQLPKNVNVVDDGDDADDDDDSDDDGDDSEKAPDKKISEENVNQKKTTTNMIPSELKEDATKNSEDSKAERLRKIKLEIEERQRMLMELAEAEDESPPTKKSRNEQSSAD